MTTIHAPASISVAVSGPSSALTMLRALAARLRHGLCIAADALRHGLRLAWHLPRTVADATLAILATDRGYRTLTGTIGSSTRGAGRLTSRSLRWIGRLAATAAHRALDFISILAPRTSDHLRQLIDAAKTWLTGALDSVEHVFDQVSGLVAALTATPLVRTVTTRLAAACSGLLALHVLTQGALASRVVHAIPATVQLVAWVTNPWMLLAGLAVSYVAVTVIAGIRLWRAGAPRPHGPEPVQDVNSGRTDDDRTFEAIVSRLRVVIEPDGSVRVDGIPSDLPESDQRDLATAAARAAVGQLDQLVRRGRPITSAQRRAVTKAAQAAARQWLSLEHLATA